MSHPESEKNSIPPLKPVPPASEKSDLDDATEAKEEKTAPKTLFRKKMGADASIFLKRKRKKVPPNEAIPEFDQPDASESPSISPLPPPQEKDAVSQISALLWRAVKEGFAKIKSGQGLRFTGIIALICLLLGFFGGRCSAPGVGKIQATSSAGEPPPSVPAWYGKLEEGLVAAKNKNDAQAALIAGALASAPQKDALYPAGWLYMRIKDRDNAVKYLTKVPSDSQYASDAATLLAILSLKETTKHSLVSKTSSAESYFQKAIAIDPLNVDAHVLYGAFLRSQSRNPSAIEQLKTALLLTRSSDTAFVYNILLKLAENDVNGPLSETPQKPDLGDEIVAAVNLWRSGSKAESLDKLRKAIGTLPPAVQRTIIQDPAFRELPGVDPNVPIAAATPTSSASVMPSASPSPTGGKPASKN